MSSSLLVDGGHRLSGTVSVSGAKNSALKLMAAALLARGESVLTNVPRIADVFTMTEHSRRPLEEIAFCYLGDARNNTASSLLAIGAILGMDVRLA